jgi:hypothetical protein
LAIFSVKTLSIPNRCRPRDRRCSRQPIAPGAGLAVVALLLIAACADNERDELRGGLYFAAGNYLAMLDLRDGSTSIVSNLGEVNILSLSPQLDKRLLLNVVDNEEHRERRLLVLYDIATRQTHTLLSGRNGHYLPGTRTLVYDDGTQIVVTERVGDSWEKTEVAAHRYNEGVDIEPVSATRFIYRIDDGPFLVYDKAAGSSTELAALASACRMDRALWFADREQMLCQSRKENDEVAYMFVGLDGSAGERLPLPASHDLRPLVYLPDQDVLLLTERWQARLTNRVKWAVWAYRFDTQEAWRLFDDQYLGHSVQYAPD